MPKAKAESIWTRAFSLLCLAEFLGYAQHYILQPTFPLYITHLGWIRLDVPCRRAALCYRHRTDSKALVELEVIEFSVTLVQPVRLE